MGSNPVTIQSPFTLSWYVYPMLFKELTGNQIDFDELFTAFSALPVPPDVSVIQAAAKADKFFHKFGVGNDLTQINRPFERFHAYELLLGTIAGNNKQKYDAIHKGTPYYFLGWTAFQTENYEKAVYYFDQSIVEDIRKSGSTDINAIRENLSVKSLLLDPQNLPGVFAALELRGEMDAAFTRFSVGSGLTLNADIFVEKFVIGSSLFLDSTFRTIVTSIYSYALEYHTLATALQLRSSDGSSLEPFFLHLFKGGLLLESILKLKCPDTVFTLDKAIKHLNKSLHIDRSVLPRNCTLVDVIQKVDSHAASNANFQDLSFIAAYGVRNTTGHNLVWSDIFQTDRDAYQRLFTLTMNAILWSVYNLWVSPNDI